MATARVNGIQIEYEISGPESGDPLLFVTGCGGQLTTAGPMVERLVQSGFRVIAFDNRDAGLSTKMDAAGVPDWNSIRDALLAGKSIPVAYTVDDMVKDAVGLLDALGIDKAHILGGSMGGMIVQLIAADYPERVLSLTSMSCTSGNPELNSSEVPDASAITEAGNLDIDALVERNLMFFSVIGSPDYPTEESVLRTRIRRDLERSHCPEGIARQMAASLHEPDRREKLKKIKAPTLVVHGEADPIMSLAGGEDTAKHIQGSRFLTFPGMGHDLPDQLIEPIVKAIRDVANQAR